MSGEKIRSEKTKEKRRAEKRNKRKREGGGEHKRTELEVVRGPGSIGGSKMHLETRPATIV